MAELPTGTVTFLFTDIESSTRLAEHLEGDFTGLLETHHRVLSEAVTSHRGVVVNTQGDAVFAVFPVAADALAAALAAQIALPQQAWPGGVEVRVRMGMHSGDAVVGATDYVGLAVHRAARVAGLAHGAQVLLSEATWRLAGPDLPPGTTVRDLGLHRLKDLTEPERIHQLVHPVLPGEFPPLRSLDAFRHNLPVAATSFVGREAELALLTKHLADARLVTLLGPGGSGKTRLALQVAAERVEEHPDGVWLAELAPVRDPAFVPAALASALGVREEPGRSLLETLENWVAGRAVLVLLDNCEHVVAAAAELAWRLLSAGPGVRMLVTSREALGLAAEQVVPVPPLRLPEPAATGSHSLEALLDSEAVRLFVERARSARPDLELGPEHASALVRICTRLDGIPLALELAARRVRALSLFELADGLEQRLRLLSRGHAGPRAGGGTEARHHTLRAAIDWSHELLEEDERVLFRRLGVFAGSFDLAAAETVCAGPYDFLDLIVALVDKSLLTAAQAAGVTRYRMLETIREYALERLAEAREDAATHQAHLAWALDLVERGEPPLPRSMPKAWTEHLDTAHDNLRAALDFAVEHDPEASVRLAGAMRGYWWVRGHWHEGRGRLEAALARAQGVAPTFRAKALAGAADLAEWQGDYGPAGSMAEEARQIFRRLGNRQGEAECCWKLGDVAMMRGAPAEARALLEEGLAICRDLPGGGCLAQLLNALGCLALDEGDFGAARHLFEETLASDPATSDAFVGGPGSYARFNLAVVRYWEGHYGVARTLLEGSLERARSLGDASLMASAQSMLGELALAEGGYAAARDLFEQGLELQRQLGEARLVADSQLRLGRLALARGDLATARSRFEEGLRQHRDLGGKFGAAAGLRGLGIVAREEKRFDEARSLLEESLAVFGELDSKDEVMTSRGELGDLALAQGDLSLARTLLEQSLAESGKLGVRRETARGLEMLGRLALAEGDLTMAESSLSAALALAGELGTLPVVADTAAGLAAVAAAAGDLLRAGRCLGFAAARRDDMESPLLPSRRSGHDGTWAAVKQALGDEEAERVWVEGAALSLDELAQR